MNTVRLFAVWLLLAGGAAWAQIEPAPEALPPPDGELQQALRRHFEKRLRAELGLTDEQAAEVMPRVKSLEQERRQAARQRMEARRQLRRAYQDGAADGELQALLDRLEEIDLEAQATQREIMKEIDEVLTVRQRVQFRAFVFRFQQEIRERLQRIRRDRQGGHRPGRQADVDPPPLDRVP